MWSKRIHDYNNGGVPSWFTSAPIQGVPSDEFIEKALNDLNERLPNATYDSLQSGADPSANDCPHTDFRVLKEDIEVNFTNGARGIKMYTVCNTCGAYGVLTGRVESHEGIKWDNKMKGHERALHGYRHSKPLHPWGEHVPYGGK